MPYTPPAAGGDLGGMTQPTAVRAATLHLARITGAIFDLDSVVTATAGAHTRSWSRVFDAAAYPATVQLIRDLRRLHVRTAIVAVGRHGEQLLAAAGVLHLFDALVDSIGGGLPGVPGRAATSAYVLAAERLGVGPDHCAVVEDGTAGILRLPGFGLVIGIDRAGHGDQDLHALGADAVVRSLAEVSLADRLLPGGNV